MAGRGAVILATASRPDAIVFAISAAIVLAGGLGVVLGRNPVHCALSLVATLGGIAVLFLEQKADFLAAVQVIVYGGAIVVLFLFVIMLLGVDRMESIEKERLPLQRILAVILGAAALGCVLVLAHVSWVTGTPSATGVANSSSKPNVTLLADSIFTSYLLPFEATAALLVIAVVAAVLLARKRTPVRTPEEEVSSQEPSADEQSVQSEKETV
jgi:NADH-quinone oxidoreductase subunit J